MTLSERLAKIESRRNAATPGPWKLEFQRLIGPEIYRDCGDRIQIAHSKDAQFIASAPQDIEFLLAALRRAITVADAACDKECNPKTCSPCKLLADLERLAGDDK